MPTETGRHRLYEKIKAEWDEENAAELMSYLPPVGWADVATKQDLCLLSVEIRAEMEKGFNSQLRWFITTMIAMTAIFGVIVATVR